MAFTVYSGIIYIVDIPSVSQWLHTTHVITNFNLIIFIMMFTFIGWSCPFRPKEIEIKIDSSKENQ